MDVKPASLRRSASSCILTDCSTAAMSFAETGFKRKSETRYLIACCAYSKSEKPEMIMTFVPGRENETLRISSSPSITGMRMSVTRRSGEISSMRASAAWPFVASPETA